MGIFKQDINQAVCDNILGEGSVFWNEWLIPSVAASAGTDKVNVYNYLAIQHFKTDFPISIQDNTLVCHSGYQGMCMQPDNLPNKYIPGLRGLDWPSARFIINCGDRDFTGEEFNSIACETLHISNVNKLNNWNIRTNSACCINSTDYIENCQFTTKKMMMCGRDLPQMKNCTSTNPVHLIVIITREPSNSYLRDFTAKINKEKRPMHRCKRWKSKNVIRLADIFDISGILVKSVTVQFREYFKGQVKFTKCNGISKSNIEGWDALYSTEP